MELFCVRNLGPDFSNCQGRLDDLGNSNRTQLVGCRMVHLICLSMLWLTTLGVSSHVPFWFVAQPASLPAPRYPEISVQDGLQSNCTMLARSMVGPCCASSFAGPSLAVSKGCSASWPPNVLVGRCRARLRLPVVQVVPTQVVELPVVEWTPCPPPRRTLCCEAQTRSRLCRREPAPSWWYLLLTGRSASGPSPVLQARNCHGRCAAPSLTVWRTVVLFGLLPGTPAVAEDNPWSDSWAIASQHSRVLPCCPSGWISCVQGGWAYSGTYVTKHACRYLSTNQSGVALDLHTLPAPSSISPPAWPVLMAPKLRRWRYKPGQRERQERREARARATEAGSYRLVQVSLH